jgi:hypothetical protein
MISAKITTLQVEFNGPIHHFLGIKFSHSWSDASHVISHHSQESDVQQLPKKKIFVQHLQSSNQPCTIQVTPLTLHQKM